MNIRVGPWDIYYFSLMALIRDSIDYYFPKGFRGQARFRLGLRVKGLGSGV